MNCKLIISLLLILTVSACLAKRNKKPAKVLPSWNIGYAGKHKVKTKADLSPSGDKAVLKFAAVKKLKVIASQVMYDFSNKQPMVAIKARVPKNSCFLTSTSFTAFSNLSDYVNASQGLKLSKPATTIILDGTAKRLSKRKLKNLSKAVRKHCSGAQVVEAVVKTKAPTGQLKNLVTLDGIVRLYVAAKTKPTKPNNNKPSNTKPNNNKPNNNKPNNNKPNNNKPNNNKPNNKPNKPNNNNNNKPNNNKPNNNKPNNNNNPTNTSTGPFVPSGFNGQGNGTTTPSPFPGGFPGFSGGFGSSNNNSGLNNGTNTTTSSPGGFPSFPGKPMPQGFNPVPSNNGSNNGTNNGTNIGTTTSQPVGAFPVFFGKPLPQGFIPVPSNNGTNNGTNIFPGIGAKPMPGGFFPGNNNNNIGG